jgi:hypothetical protein
MLRPETEPARSPLTSLLALHGACFDGTLQRDFRDNWHELHEDDSEKYVPGYM